MGGGVGKGGRELRRQVGMTRGYPVAAELLLTSFRPGEQGVLMEWQNVRPNHRQS